MKIDDRLKKFIFKKLAKDLSHVEVIPYEGDIWFIDRDNKFWYLKLKKNGDLWWRYVFFGQFFKAFSLQRDDYDPIIAEWVEQVLKRKVDTTSAHQSRFQSLVEQVLKRKVDTTAQSGGEQLRQVEQVLNSK
jgi:hypothetical protein